MCRRSWILVGSTVLLLGLAWTAGFCQPAFAADQWPPNGSSRSFQLHLAPDGFLAGRLSRADANGLITPASNLRLMFSQSGVVRTQGQPGIGGVFQVGGLQPGVYACFAAGPDGFLANGVQLLPPAGLGEGPMQLDALVVPPTDVPVLTHLVQRHLPVAATTPAMPGMPPYPQQPSMPVGIQPISQQSPIASAPLIPIPAPVKHPTVTLQPDGRLAGRLLALSPQPGVTMPATGLTVYLIQNGVLAQQTSVDTNGLFQMPSVQPGFYTLAAAGSTGFAAIGVQVVQPPGTVQRSNEVGTIRLVKASQPPSFDLEVAVIGPENFPLLSQILGTGQFFPGMAPPGPLGPGGGGPFGGGGLFGPGGGGGFGGGGGGLLGALLGAGAGAALGAALADDDDDDEVVLASPFLP